MVAAGVHGMMIHCDQWGARVEPLAPHRSELILPFMPRRIHVPIVSTGEVTLPAAQAHHARNVLRMDAGEAVELFDDAGNVAEGTIARCDATGVVVAVTQLVAVPDKGFHLTMATALPKGQRCDWMIEKLAEIGVDRFVPLSSARSIVKPEGTHKIDRWKRLATEAARQSRGSGVMTIETLVDVRGLVNECASVRPANTGEPPGGWYLSTAPDAMTLDGFIGSASARRLILFIGPEGGWTNEEIASFESAGVRALSLTTTILRVETAAVVAAGAVASLRRFAGKAGATGMNP